MRIPRACDYCPSDTTAVWPKCDDCKAECQSLHIIPHIEVRETGGPGGIIIRSKQVCSSCYYAKYFSQSLEDYSTQNDKSGEY